MAPRGRGRATGCFCCGTYVLCQADILRPVNQVAAPVCCSLAWVCHFTRPKGSGAAIFIFDPMPGLYVTAITIVVNTCYMITDAWILEVGVYQEKTQ